MPGGYLSIGGYTLDQDAAWFTIHRTGILGRTNRIIKTRNLWTIDGRVNGLTTAAVDAKVVAFENSIRDGMDLVFSIGSTMNLISANCCEGTHVKQLSWLAGYDGVRGSGAEHLLRRTFKLVVYGDIIDITDTYITSWHETLSFIGHGAANTVPVTSLQGFVQAQQVQAITPVWVHQSGSATGQLSSPNPPTPYFLSTAYYPPTGHSISYSTPSDWGVNQSTQYGVRWSYRGWLANVVTPYTPPQF